MNKRKLSGFTLAELLIVVAIIGVLAGISIPIFNSQLEKAREAVDIANMRSAKASAVAEYLTDPDEYTDGYRRFYDASKGAMSDIPPEGYGKSSKDVSEFKTIIEGASGIPNPGSPSYVTVVITSNNQVSLIWGGNDLTTAEGRKQEDLDNMKKFAEALMQGLEDGVFQTGYTALNKNFVLVTVYPNGTVDYLSDAYTGDGRSEERVNTIKTALANAGVTIEGIKAYASQDGNWPYGYTVMYDMKEKKLYYLATARDDRNGQTSWRTWMQRDGKIIEEFDLSNN